MLYPTVDVIIPAYNARDFIVEAIQSVKCQTYAARVIVVDDGSTDGTADVVKDRFGLDGSVCYVRKDNGGLSSARNRGLREAAADFIGFLDADDVWFPNKLSEQIEVFRRTTDPKLGVVYCNFEPIDREGRRISNTAAQLDLSVRGDVFCQLLRGNFVAGSGSAVLVRKECFQVTGPFDEALPSCEDWDMWLRLARHFHFDYVSEPLVQIRRHAGAMNRDARRMFVGHIIFFNKWANEVAKRPTVLEGWRRQYAIPMIAAIMRELPGTELYGLLAKRMSPELGRLAARQIPHILRDLIVEAARKIWPA